VRGERELELPEWLAMDWARVQRWARLCSGGRCRYAALEATADGPLFAGHGDDCPGYGGVLVVVEGQPLVRVTICPRRAEWWERRRVWLRDHRVAERASARIGRRAPLPSE
jgi:hypothetical protein